MLFELHNMKLRYSNLVHVCNFVASHHHWLVQWFAATSKRITRNTCSALTNMALINSVQSVSYRSSLGKGNFNVHSIAGAIVVILILYIENFKWTFITIIADAIILFKKQDKAAYWLLSLWCHLKLIENNYYRFFKLK